MALVKIVFPPEHLRRALMPFGPIMGLATVAGPILAGCCTWTCSAAGGVRSF
ncbi:hypothetical protein [Pseudonocardia acaciae]|uniref:hypothetical protein n=1 Tax=Pseudonocardia acaciae TaxID=551276 RepID=UPI001B808CB9|nr:hypothetical protein [Pseudonocardia acaciae]